MVTALPSTRTDVLVVGAGPTGLMAALVLARAGVDAEIVDPKPGPTRESRALGVQARSMELYDQLGLVDRVLAESVTAPALELGWLDRPSRRLPLDFLQQRVSPFPGLHVFEQSRNETLLTQALQECGRTVRWGERLVELRLDTATDHAPDHAMDHETDHATDDRGESGVEALIDRDGELSLIRARWCIGADGASSLVRRLLDIPFDGVTDRGRFWVADVRGLHGLSDEVISLRFGPDDLLLAFPLGPGGHHRLLGVVGDAEPTAQSVLPVAARRYGFHHDHVEWFAHYRVHHRVAARFRRGPVFLAGDAAHVHSPVGGQGMNTGLQDAHDLALAIADVVGGRTAGSAGADRRLDRYQAERQPVARHLVALTDRLFSVMSGRDRTRSLIRRLVATRFAPVVLGALPRLPAGSRAGGYLGQTRIRYPMPASDDPVVGRRLPPTPANRELLRAFGWQLHRYRGSADSTADHSTAAGSSATQAGRPDWISGPYELPADPDGRLSADRTYLIRPDGFVAASAPTDNPAAVRSAVDAVLIQHGLRTD